MATKPDATMLDVTGTPSGTVAAGDSFTFSDVDDSGDAKSDTVQGILDLAAPGGRVLLETLTPSGASTASLTAAAIFSGTYEKIVIEMTGMTQSGDGIETHFLVSDDGGSTYKTSLYSYKVERSADNATTYLANASTAAASITFANPGAAATESADRTIQVKNLEGTTKYKLFQWDSVEMDSGGNLRNTSGVGTWKGTAAIDAIRFAPTSGTLSGTIRAYGIPNT